MLAVVTEPKRKNFLEKWRVIKWSAAAVELEFFSHFGAGRQDANLYHANHGNQD